MGKKKKQKGRWFVIIVVLTTVIVVPLTYLFLVAWGEKSGTEFSPDDFSFRQFDYCRLPFFGWTHRGIKHTVSENDFASTLIDDDWIRPSGRSPKRWHLVNEHSSSFISVSQHSIDCDAHFLTDYFDMVDKEGLNRVANWNDTQPKSAKVLWPLIAEMARGNLYLQVPKVMEFALEYSQPDKSKSFKLELTNQISEAWYQAGLTDQANDRHKQAIERFDQAIALGENGHRLAETAKSKSLAAAP